MKDKIVYSTTTKKILLNFWFKKLIVFLEILTIS